MLSRIRRGRSKRAGFLVWGIVALTPLVARAEAAEGTSELAQVSGPPPAFASVLLMDLRRRRVELDRREWEIQGRESALRELETEVEKRIEEFEGLRAALEKRLVELEGRMGDQVAKIAKTYAAMPADRAASLVTALDTDLATAILRKMRPKQSAAVLAGMPEERAQLMSRLLARPFDVDTKVRP